MTSWTEYRNNLRAQIQAIIDLTCEAASIKTPKWRFAPKRGAAQWDTWHISIPYFAEQWGEKYLIYYVCHEIAHLILGHPGYRKDFKAEEQRLCGLWGIKITGYSRGGGKYAGPTELQ